MKKLAPPESLAKSGTPAASTAPPSSPPTTGSPESVDVALISGPTEDGKGMRIIRARNDRIELGDVRPLEPGKPIHGEVVRLKPRREFPALCDVEVAYAPEGEARPVPKGRKGPAQVASEQYRNNYDQIWSAPSKKVSLPN